MVFPGFFLSSVFGLGELGLVICTININIDNLWNIKSWGFYDNKPLDFHEDIWFSGGR